MPRAARAGFSCYAARHPRGGLLLLLLLLLGCKDCLARLQDATKRLRESLRVVVAAMGSNSCALVAAGIHYLRADLSII